MDARYDRHEVRSREPIQGGDWKHFAFTWDSTSGLELYVDAQIVGSTRGTDSWWLAQLPGLFQLPAGNSAYDELYIFDRPLEETEIHDLYVHNQPPKRPSGSTEEPPGVKTRLEIASGVTTELNLPIAEPSDGQSSLVFEEIWTDQVTDGHIPGLWVMDGRYELAWPHPYSVFTISFGDADFHAEKVDIQPPPDKTINYITVEGNLEGIKVLALEDEAGIHSRTLLEVPRDHGFFYGARVPPTRNQPRRIPFVKGWGTPYGYRGDVRFALTGNTRLHEVGLFNVATKTPLEGTPLYLKEGAVTPGERYGLALQTFVVARDAAVATTTPTEPVGPGNFFRTGAFRRLHVISAPFERKNGIASVRLDLYLRTRLPEDVMILRLRDPAVPSRIWTHAEVKARGFDSSEPRLLSLTLDMVDLAVAGGDRLWLDVTSVDGVEILVGDRQRRSRLVVNVIPLATAVVQYSPKQVVPARTEYQKIYEGTPEKLKIEADLLRPKSYGGIFDMVYPVRAILRVDPDHDVANHLWDLVSGTYNSAGQSSDWSTVELRDFDGPENAPRWVIYQRAYNRPRRQVGEWYAARQNPDGQMGGGWNVDTLFFLNDPFDVCVDSNESVKRMNNNIARRFERTGMFEDGYARLYPMDRHHTRDFVHLQHCLVILNVGEVRTFEKTLEIAWHHGRPDRTPVNYSLGIPFVASYNSVRWYWGDTVPEEPFVNDDEERITRDLHQWASYINNDTVLWYLTEGWTHTDNRNIYSSHEFYGILLGGDRPKADDPELTLCVTWPQGGGPDVSRWVEYGDDRRLKVRMYSFDEKDRALTARLMRLAKGKYSVLLAPDRDHDGEPEDRAAARIVTLRRFSDLTLNVPPRVPLVLDIRQVESLGDPGPLPDLALDPEDIQVDRNYVAVSVHNLGNAPARNVRITLLLDGNPVETKAVELIEAPVDFVPKRYTVYFHRITGGRVVGAVIDSQDAIEELVERNNRAEATDSRTVGYFTW